MPKMYEDAELPDGVELYDFEDFDKHRELMFRDAHDALLKQFPKVHNGVRMELADVAYADPETYSIAEQKKALHNDKYLTRRLRGTVRLFDAKSGDLLDEKANITLMRVPYITERGTIIRDGNEWGAISQQRLLPGAYSRYQNNGDLETQFNVRPGTGNAFRVSFNPESTQYKFNIGGSELHLYSLLHDLGVSDESLKEKWGEDVYAENAGKYDPRTIEKAYMKIVPDWDRKANPGRSQEEKVALIKNALNRSQVATNVVKKTLPNLFDRMKAASWKEDGELLEKCASMTHKDLSELAVYINHATDQQINPDGTNEQIIEEIRNVLHEGTASGQATLQDKDEPAYKAVQQFRATVVYNRIRKKIEKIYKQQ